MTSHRLWKFSVIGLRLTCVVAVIFALGLSGAGSAERIFAETSKAQAAAAAEQNTLYPQPSESAEQGSMAKGSGPCSEQAALHAPIGITPDNDTRCRGLFVSSPRMLAVALIAVDNSSPIQSSALVSSRLAEQSTLIGAKPSGTM